jgi:hypothetical protein
MHLSDDELVSPEMQRQALGWVEPVPVSHGRRCLSDQGHLHGVDDKTQREQGCRLKIYTAD